MCISNFCYALSCTRIKSLQIVKRRSRDKLWFVHITEGTNNHRNGKVFRLTALVFTGDDEACVSPVCNICRGDSHQYYFCIKPPWNTMLLFFHKRLQLHEFYTERLFYFLHVWRMDGISQNALRNLVRLDDMSLIPFYVMDPTVNRTLSHYHPRQLITLWMTTLIDTP